MTQTDWKEVVEQWRKLPPEERLRIHLSRIHHKVARSMAFETELSGCAPVPLPEVTRAIFNHFNGHYMTTGDNHD